MDPFYEKCLRDCQHPNLQQRLQALDILGKEYLELVDAQFLLSLLRRETSFQAQSAIMGIMSQLGPQVPIEELANILNDRTEEGLRSLAAGTLAAQGGRAPIKLFIRILQDPTEEIGLRETIAELLGGLGEYVPLDVLIATAGDADPAFVRRGLVRWLSKARVPRSNLSSFRCIILSGGCVSLRYEHRVRPRPALR